jgi:DNA-binding response OmpR family regulator
MTAGTALLLEDEALIALDVEQSLVSEGFDVLSFASCSDALNWLETATPTLAIIDVTLTDGDGDEAAQTLAARHVPFIVYSGAAPDVRLRPAFRAGHWLSKPSGPGDLVAAIRKFVAGMGG